MIGDFLTRGVLAVVLAALACGETLAAEKVSVRLNWVPGTEHSFLYLAREKGWFADAGIDLEILAGQGSTVAVKTVGAGETAFAIADVATVARGWEAGVPLVAAAVLLKESPTVVYSLKAKNITKMSDLCGKKVGINIKSTTSEQYRAMVRMASLKDCEITEVPISGGRRQGSHVGCGRCGCDLLLRGARATSGQGTGNKYHPGKSVLQALQFVDHHKR